MGFKSRQVWKLPEGLSLLPEEEQAVIRSLDRYYPEAVRSGFHQTRGAAGNCAYASHEFIHILHDEGIMGVIEKFDFNLETDKEDFPVSLKNAHATYWHVAVRVESLVIDWTARQFDHQAPFPGLWTIAPVGHRNRPLKWRRRGAEGEPMCVFWRSDLDGSGEGGGWCLVKGGVDPDCWHALTQCGRMITLPGRFQARKPTCDACKRIFEKGIVRKTQDLSEAPPRAC